MKKVILAAMVLFLVGCTTTVYVPVWTAPKFDKPVRPVLVSDGKGTQGEVARKANLDFINMTEYDLKLENLLKAIEAQSGVPAVDLKK